LLNGPTARFLRGINNIMKKLVITGEHVIYNIKEDVPTPDACTFVICDIEEKKLLFKKEPRIELKSDLIDQGRPTFHPFGIASDSESIYIASNDRIGKFDRSTYEYLGNLNVPAFINTHQIIKHNDYLFICHTAVDAIGLHNLKTNTCRYLKFPEWELVDSVETPINAYDKDTVHVNSFCVHDDKLYFCLHNNIKKNSAFGYIDLKTFDIIRLFEAGFGAHNVGILNGKLYSLSTKTGSLIEHNFEKDRQTYYSLVPHNKVFLRGMRVDDNRLLIACSNHYGDHYTQIKKISSCIAEFDPQTEKFSPIMFIPQIPFIMDIHLI
jgi:hypothetical protein